MTTTTELMTADELFLMPKDGCRYELVKGEMRKMSPAGSEHGAIIVNLTLLLAQYVKANQLGVVFGAETGFKIARNPDTVRAPDVAFVRRENIPSTGIPKQFWDGAPDLAVEVLSPGDAADYVEEKVDEWLKAGAGTVWVVSPKRRTVTIHHSLNEAITLRENDELTDENVVPGFHCRVAEIFI